jgi:hypothetical protein
MLLTHIFFALFSLTAIPSAFKWHFSCPLATVLKWHFSCPLATVLKWHFSCQLATVLKRLGLRGAVLGTGLRSCFAMSFSPKGAELLLRISFYALVVGCLRATAYEKFSLGPIEFYQRRPHIDICNMHYI